MASSDFCSIYTIIFTFNIKVFIFHIINSNLYRYYDEHAKVAQKGTPWRLVTLTATRKENKSGLNGIKSKIH